MAIILPQDDPAFERLKSQGTPVKSDAGTIFGRFAGANEAVTLGLVNIMPSVYMNETVDLILDRFSKAPYDVRPVFISLEGPKKGISWDAAKKENLDAVLITGYATANLPFEQVHFNQAARDVLDDTHNMKLPLFAVCAGAMLAANHYYGIEKIPATRLDANDPSREVPHKYLGYLPYEGKDGKTVHVATSRLNTLHHEQFQTAIREHGLDVPLLTRETLHPEPAVFTDPARHRIFTMAHFEYKKTKSLYPGFDQPLDILTYQYQRDQKSNDPELRERVQPPINPEPSSEQVRIFEDYSNRLFTGFIEDAAQLKASRKPALQAEQKFVPVPAPAEVLAYS